MLKNENGNAGDQAESSSEAGRLCFVIMPFSSTDTCSKEEWTAIFEELIKPAVARAGYDCRRADALRGNVVKEILEDLSAAWVVIADLTDRNPNVFYELGVRHALRDRTVLIAQDRAAIPFDLQAYANHVYRWQDDDGREEFERRVHELLKDVDIDPERSDNPVSDFLGGADHHGRRASLPHRVAGCEERLDDLEAAFRVLGSGEGSATTFPTASRLVGSGVLSGEQAPMAWHDLGCSVSAARDAQSLRHVQRAIISEVRRDLSEIIVDLRGSQPIVSSVVKSEIGALAHSYETALGGTLDNVESLLYGLVSCDWKDGARAVLSVAGELASTEARAETRFATGLPAFLAWRIILNCGAIAWAHRSFEALLVLLSEPLPVRQPGGRIMLRPLWQHAELYHPEHLLGYADLAIQRLMAQVSEEMPVSMVMTSQEELNVALVAVLALLALSDARSGESNLYPIYRLIPQFREGIADLVAAVRTHARSLVVALLDAPEPELEEEWRHLAVIANRASLGSTYLFASSRIPEDLSTSEL